MTADFVKSPYMANTEPEAAKQPFKRTGLAKGLVELPEDFDEHFNDLDGEIAEMFDGSVL